LSHERPEPDEQREEPIADEPVAYPHDRQHGPGEPRAGEPGDRRRAPEDRGDDDPDDDEHDDDPDDDPDDEHDDDPDGDDEHDDEHGTEEHEPLEESHAEEESESEEEHEPDEEEDEDEEGLESVTIEISGLSLYTHHGVSEAEREVGQRLMLDLRLEVGETDATVTDRIEDTVDYAEVCQLVALVAQQRSHRTLERLCSTIAERLLADYDLEGVWVKATKPEPPIPLPVEEVSVEVWREAEE
jgi:7,8-dihydroneopterin aldolase/epimerase/oxygenase